MTDQSPVEQVPDDAAEASRARPVRAKTARRKRGPSLAVQKVFGTAFRIWGRNLIPFTLLALIVFVPLGWFLAWVDATPEFADEDQRPYWLNTANLLLTRLSGLLVAAPVIGAVFAELRGKRVSLAMTLGPGLLRLPRAVGVAIAQGVVIVGGMIPTALLAAVGVPLPLVVILMFATAVLIVILMLGFYVAVPVAIVERCSVVRALVRSWRLTRGSRLRIFVVTLFFGLLAMLLGATAGGLLTIAIPDVPLWVWTTTVTAVVASMEAVFAAVVYHDLRLAIDGADPDEVAHVFE